jgi:hypothetical protein
MHFLNRILYDGNAGTCINMYLKKKAASRVDYLSVHVLSELFPFLCCTSTGLGELQVLASMFSDVRDFVKDVTKPFHSKIATRQWHFTSTIYLIYTLMSYLAFYLHKTNAALW